MCLTRTCSYRGQSLLTLALLLAMLHSCATLRTKQIQYENFVTNEQYEAAAGYLQQAKHLHRDKNYLLLMFEQGKVAHLLGDYEASNRYFNTADSIIENYHINVGLEAASYMINPEITTYKPEDFEKVAIHWYKALNQIYLNNYENAMVEVRRLNLRLQQINDKYPEHKNRYSSDALAVVLMGLIFEATGEYDNAFVSYRNAWELFTKTEDEGQPGYMGVEMPEQLKADLIYMAHRNGYASDVDYFQRQFEMTLDADKPEGGELILFVENGLGPYKSQLDIMFSLLKGKAGFVTFNNDEYGFTFPVYLGNSNDNSDLGDVQVVRAAFPKYELRTPVYQEFGVRVNGGDQVNMSQVESFDEIAKKTLKDRLLREMGQVLLRLAVKKASEIALRQENETAGALLGLANAITEKADTRNWQTLPAEVYYLRVPLKTGPNRVTLTMSGPDGQTNSQVFEVEGRGGLQFRSVYVLKSVPKPPPGYYYGPSQSAYNSRSY